MIPSDPKSCNANKVSLSVRTPAPSAIKSSSPQRRGPSDFYEGHWIPAVAGMTGWPRATNRISPLTLPVKAAARGWRLATGYAVFMRLTRHAWPRSRLGAAPSNGKHNVAWVKVPNPTSRRNRKPVGVRASPQPTRPVSMRLSSHAWPRSNGPRPPRLGAASSNGKQNVGWVEERNPTSLRHGKPPRWKSLRDDSP